MFHADAGASHQPRRWLPGVILASLAGAVSTEAAPQVLENDSLRVSIQENGSIAFRDKVHDVAWGSDVPGWVELWQGDRRETLSLSTSEVEVATDVGSLRALFRGVSGAGLADPGFRMQVRASLAPSHFDVVIESLSARFDLRQLEYPAHLLSVKSGTEGGYVVVPNAQGVIIPSRYDAGFMRHGQNVWEAISDLDLVWSFESGMLNMPWFGASRAASSVLVRVDTPSDARLHVVGNAVVSDEGEVVEAARAQNPGTRLSSLAPIWMGSYRGLTYPRRIRIEPVSNGYVGMARRYREYAEVSGRRVTLKEKIRRVPDVQKLIGAPDVKVYVFTNRIDDPYYRAWSQPVLDGYSKVHTTFDQVAEIARDLKDMGVERCLVLLAGWNRAGYDREHVDMWPPAAGAGGAEGLRRAARAVREKGYLFALHDNYHDLYLDAPSYDEGHTLKRADGSIVMGGIWDGGLCHRICPARQQALLDRNLALILPTVPLSAYYLDVSTSAHSNECYDPRHPLTRREDLEHRRAVLESLVERGLVVGGERGTDWAVPVAAFFEGLHGGGTGYHRGLSYRVGLTIPLFHLVYHDCVVGYWQHGTPFGREDHANHILHDLLTAQPSSWSLVYDQWEDLKPLIRETYELLGRLHERTALHPMVSHEVMSEDFNVQRSEFGDGTAVRVNYGITSYRDGDTWIPPKGFELRVPGEPVRIGSVSRRITYVTN